ncbi:MAG: HAD family hydrolase [Bacteroidales bacterium]|nr:HAD family hydrolase [Bacteroidales bacterium]MCF8391337.1 HAD family hydrolase [Bacteroidales bacterium]
MKKNKAIFLDRDGVINNEESNYYIFRTEDFFLNEGLAEALKELSRRGYIFIVITNQGGISKNLYSSADVEKVHEKLNQLLAGFGVHLEEIYYCPHHSDEENCLCRKPKNLTIEKAIARFNIDREKSWLVGDRDTDIEAGKLSGLKTIKVKSNENMRFLSELIVD